MIREPLHHAELTDFLFTFSLLFRGELPIGPSDMKSYYLLTPSGDYRPVHQSVNCKRGPHLWS